MTISKLKQLIDEQKQENIRLYNIFQYKMHKEEMEPLIQQWREGSTKLKVLDNQLYELEKKERDEKRASKTKETKTFINGYGEATNKYITSSTYERVEKRRQKEVMLFMGVR